MNTSEIEDIFNELISVYQNLKAEVLIAEVQERKNIKFDQIVINNKSTFKRPYRRDLLKIEKSNLKEDVLSLDLSRNGVYDYLPEGLFHKQENDNSKTFTTKRLKSKKEELAARSFFSPVENEFFNQRLNIEKNERVLLNNFYSLKDDYLIDFWKLNTDMPREYLLKLIKLLPYAFKIAGDLELARLSLEKILKNKVGFEKKYHTNLKPNKRNRKKYLILGVDSVLDNIDHTILQPYLEVTIWLKDSKEIKEYISTKGIDQFLAVFYDYFLPLELDIKTKYEVNNIREFSLSKDSDAIIGISTKI